mgnify:CR=1 FL=1
MCLCVVGGAGLGRYRGQGSGLGLYRGQGSGLLGSVAQGLAHPGALDMDMAASKKRVVCEYMYVCVCVCVCERERER